MGNTVVLVLSHLLDAHVWRMFKSIKQACEGRLDVRLLGDNTRGVFNRHSRNPCFSLFERVDLERLGYPGKSHISYLKVPAKKKHQDRNFTMGNTELPLLRFYRHNPNYDRYWIVEYDVRYTGSWLQFFSYFDGYHAALLTTSVVRYEETPTWPWWSSMVLADATIEKRDFLRGFFPVYRLSNEALSQLDRDYRKGSRGHYECLVPTLLGRAGLEIEDIGGDGRFVRAANVNRFYRNRPANHNFAPGTFVFRPRMYRPGDEPDKLWHPVKHRSLWQSAKLHARRRLRRIFRRQS
jgi:hypothetical protein